MKLAVFGATGGVGQQLVPQALARGHEVVAVARGAAAVPDGVRLVRGEVYEPAVAMEAVAGVDAVLSCLGPKRVNPANPWSAVASPPDFAARSAAHIVAAMKHHGVKRAVAVGAAGTGETYATLNVAMKLLLATSKLGPMYADVEAMEKVWLSSGLDVWVPRPCTLNNGPVSGKVVVVPAFGLLSAISRADVAAWMLDALERPVVGEPSPMIARG